MRGEPDHIGGWEGLGAGKVSSRGLESHPELLISSRGYCEGFRAQESMRGAIPLKATPTLHVGEGGGRHRGRKTIRNLSPPPRGQAGSSSAHQAPGKCGVPPQ